MSSVIPQVSSILEKEAVKYFDLEQVGAIISTLLQAVQYIEQIEKTLDELTNMIGALKVIDHPKVIEMIKSLSVEDASKAVKNILRQRKATIMNLQTKLGMIKTIGQNKS